MDPTSLEAERGFLSVNPAPKTPGPETLNGVQGSGLRDQGFLVEGVGLRV